jgi:propane monooxygenase reductase subunit
VYSARVEPSGKTFSLKPDENILDAALRGGVPFKYGCRHGNCSSCKYLVTDGDVDFGAASPYSLSNAERDEGWVLLCCATALDDLEIQDDRVQDGRQLPVLAPIDLTCEVVEVEWLTADLRRLKVRLDRAMEFYAGQFVEIETPGVRDQWRSYSIASAPAASPDLSFVIKVIDGGVFSGKLDQMPPNTQLRLRGPFGTGYLREGERPILLVATGSGISPILSILEHAVSSGDGREFTLFYGARTAADLPCESRIAEIRELLDLTYNPVLSRPTPECDWSGEPGQRVTTSVLRRIGDGYPYDAYLCGKPQMCDEVTALLEAKGTPEESIFSDRFFPALEPE